MFEEYLQDSYEFLLLAKEQKNDRDARRYFRASVFYAAGAIEAFVNYVADSFAKAGNISDYEISFLSDRVLFFSADKGLTERTEYHRLDQKIRVLMRRFVSGFDFQSPLWSRFMAFKEFRDSLVHPRQSDDETPLSDYRKKVKAGLAAVIEIMNELMKGIFGSPLRKQLLDLVPE